MNDDLEEYTKREKGKKYEALIDRYLAWESWRAGDATEKPERCLERIIEDMRKERED